MTIAFYEHPFSSYVQKAKTAFYEKGIPFEAKIIDGSEPDRRAASDRPLADPCSRHRLSAVGENSDARRPR